MEKTSTDGIPDGPNQYEPEAEKDRPSSRESSHIMWHKSRIEAPLFYWPLANVPVEEKLAQMRKALENGSDPNEVDHSTHPQYQYGRPLHMCMDYPNDDSDSDRYLDNAPVIKLLLDYGADPRLYGVPSNPYMIGYPGRPVDDARKSLAAIREQRASDFQYERVRQETFWEEAYTLMKEAEDRLDGKQTSKCTLM